MTNNAAKVTINPHLAALDLGLWWPRATKHPHYANQSMQVEIHPLIMRVTCLVLLPMPRSWQTTIPQAAPAQVIEQAITQTAATATKTETATWENLLHKMLAVLELNQASTNLAIAKIYTDKDKLSVADWQQVANTIQCWQPQWILQFDHANELCLGQGCGVKTFHPTELLANPQHKASAYRSLLALKQLIYGACR